MIYALVTSWPRFRIRILRLPPPLAPRGRGPAYRGGFFLFLYLSGAGAPEREGLFLDALLPSFLWSFFCARCNGSLGGTLEKNKDKYLCARERGPISLIDISPLSPAVVLAQIKLCSL